MHLEPEISVKPLITHKYNSTVLVNKSNLFGFKVLYNNLDWNLLRNKYTNEVCNHLHNTHTSTHISLLIRYSVSGIIQLADIGHHPRGSLCVADHEILFIHQLSAQLAFRAGADTAKTDGVNDRHNYSLSPVC